MLLFAAAAPNVAAPEPSGQSALALLILIVVAGGWIGLRWLFRQRHSAEAEAVVHGDFAEFALQVLANAARIDGQVNEPERQAIAASMIDIAGESFDATRVERALSEARLNKDQLVDYLRVRASAFTRDQKTRLLTHLLTLIVVDDRFDEVEHVALMDYTEAVGFDRKSAPETLRGLMSDFAKGRIT